MSNLGKPFLLPVNNYIGNKDKQEWEHIIKKVDKFLASLPEVKPIINMNYPLKTRIENHLQKDSIYKLPRDLFSRSK